MHHRFSRKLFISDAFSTTVACGLRFTAGLFDPAPVTAAPLEGEWIDLKPRWPLTDQVAIEFDRRTPNYSNRKRLHESLTDLTRKHLKENIAEGKNTGISSVYQ